jgi:hypothetical protein
MNSIRFMARRVFGVSIAWVLFVGTSFHAAAFALIGHLPCVRKS